MYNKYRFHRICHIHIFIGMSIPTLAATRVLLGGEEQELTFEKFPFTGLSKVGSF